MPILLGVSVGASKTAESVKWDWRGGGAVSKQDVGGQSSCRTTNLCTQGACDVL